MTKETMERINGELAERVSGMLEAKPMTEGGERPQNGAKALVHSWERESDDGAIGYDSWEVMTWLEAGTEMDLGTKANPAQGGSAEDGLIRAITGKRAIQTIKEDGFYWMESEPSKDGFCHWRKLADGGCDLWVELKGTRKGELIEKKSEEEGKEVLFHREARLWDGSSIFIKTVPSKEWKDGKPLPPDVGAFLWCRKDRKGMMIAGESGSLSARFRMPEDGRWDEDKIADQVISHILWKEYGIRDPRGCYSLI